MLNTKNEKTEDTSRTKYFHSDIHRGFCVTQYLPMIKGIARPFMKQLPAALDLDDLMSVGMCGLWDAMSRFDPSRQVTFEAFAKHRIRGAIIDEIRRMNWISRRTYERINTVGKTEQRWQQQHQEGPTTSQVAQCLGETSHWVEDVKQQRQNLLDYKLSHQEDEREVTFEQAISTKKLPNESYELNEQSQALQTALLSLSPREAAVIRGYYFSDEPMKVVGKQLGLTESRVSQIHSHALNDLRLKHWDSPLKQYWGNVA